MDDNPFQEMGSILGNLAHLLRYCTYSLVSSGNGKTLVQHTMVQYQSAAQWQVFPSGLVYTFLLQPISKIQENRRAVFQTVQFDNLPNSMLSMAFFFFPL